jgi:hypothetical protein
MHARVPTSEGVNPGTYEARFAGIEEKNSDQYGTFWAWQFDVLLDDGPRSVSGASSPKLGRSTKARGWVEVLLGRDLEPGEDVDFEMLVDRPCMVVVEADSRGYGKVGDVLPPLRSTKSAEQSLDDLPFR